MEGLKKWSEQRDGIALQFPGAGLKVFYGNHRLTQVDAVVQQILNIRSGLAMQDTGLKAFDANHRKTLQQIGRYIVF